MEINQREGNYKWRKGQGMKWAVGHVKGGSAMNEDGGEGVGGS